MAFVLTSLATTNLLGRTHRLAVQTSPICVWVFAEISSEEETKRKSPFQKEECNVWAFISHSLNEVIVSSLLMRSKVVSDPNLQIKGREKVGQWAHARHDLHT